MATQLLCHRYVVFLQSIRPDITISWAVLGSCHPPVLLIRRAAVPPSWRLQDEALARDRWVRRTGLKNV